MIVFPNSLRGLCVWPAVRASLSALNARSEDTAGGGDLDSGSTGLVTHARTVSESEPQAEDGGWQWMARIVLSLSDLIPCISLFSLVLELPAPGLPSCSRPPVILYSSSDLERGIKRKQAAHNRQRDCYGRRGSPSFFLLILSL